MAEGVDFVTVAHTDRYMELARELERAVTTHHPDEAEWTFTVVDNRRVNRGFARGCNCGAKTGDYPIVAFVNPDLRVTGPFLPQIRHTLLQPDVQVTGSNFGKNPSEYRRIWGCDQWVCGAAFFVRRSWWEQLRGFDEHYEFGFDETDFIRRTQEAGGKVRSIALPLFHQSPSDDPPEIAEYKRRHFEAGARRFYKRWPPLRHAEPARRPR